MNLSIVFYLSRWSQCFVSVFLWTNNAACWILYDRIFFCRIARDLIDSQKELLTKMKDEGRLEKYLEEEPNFLHSLLSDPRVTEESATSMVTTLFGAGIETVSIFMYFCHGINALTSKTRYDQTRELSRLLQHCPKKGVVSAPANMFYPATFCMRLYQVMNPEFCGCRMLLYIGCCFSFRCQTTHYSLQFRTLSSPTLTKIVFLVSLFT